MTEQTERPRTVYLWFLLLLVLGMRISSAMTGFTGHTAMISLLLRGGDFTMAIGTGFGARVI
jgi:hypothetical protein